MPVMRFTDEQQTAWMDCVLAARDVMSRRFGGDLLNAELLHACCPDTNPHLPGAAALEHQFGVPKTTLLRRLETLESRGWLQPVRNGARVVYRTTPVGIALLTTAITENLEAAVKTLERTGVCDPREVD
jgi:hypothetical protein